MNSLPDSSAPRLLTRREAIQRAAVFFGLALSPSILTGALQAQTTVGGRSRYLSPRQLDVAGAIVDRILPRTDTPGALDVGVLTFVDLMYGEYMTLEERERFINGLELTEAASLAKYQLGYGRLSLELRDRVLTAVAEASADEEKSFFLQIKELAIVGYFTSETVIKTVLRYEPVPGPFRGNIPVSEVGKATWAPSR
jgi:gluconate 2-dehydrogenase gamma chain